MNSLDHRNVIKLYEIFDEAKYMKLVMEARRAATPARGGAGTVPALVLPHASVTTPLAPDPPCHLGICANRRTA